MTLMRKGSHYTIINNFVLTQLSKLGASIFHRNCIQYQVPISFQKEANFSVWLCIQQVQFNKEGSTLQGNNKLRQFQHKIVSCIFHKISLKNFVNARKKILLNHFCTVVAQIKIYTRNNCIVIYLFVIVAGTQVARYNILYILQLWRLPRLIVLIIIGYKVLKMNIEKKLSDQIQGRI